MAETAPQMKSDIDDYPDLSSPEIKTLHYAPEKVRLFLVADNTTQAQISEAHSTLRNLHDVGILRRIYAPFTAIPIATLNTEDNLLQIGQTETRRPREDPDFLHQLRSSLLHERNEEIVFSGPRVEFAPADGVSMLMARFSNPGHDQRFKTVANEMIRDLQQYLLGVNCRRTDKVMSSGGINWMHRPGPYLPLGRPSRSLTPNERDHIACVLAEKLPDTMHFRPYVAIPEPANPLSFDPADRDQGDSSRATASTDNYIDSTPLSLIERAVKVAREHPSARVELYDEASDRTIIVNPDHAQRLERLLGHCSTMFINFHPDQPEAA